jgi:hypothetical protein
MYGSDDSGQSRARRQQGLSLQFDTMVQHIAVDDGESVFAVSGPELFASHDASESWQRLAEGCRRYRRWSRCEGGALLSAP